MAKLYCSESLPKLIVSQSEENLSAKCEYMQYGTAGLRGIVTVGLSTARLNIFKDFERL
ncbi:MAG: hypothetical protein ACREBS_07640 [Nitrososphaerales archaeon]